MFRTLWTLSLLFAAFLPSRSAWEASTSQNLGITVTAATQPNSTAPPQATSFYVATNGNDSNPGTLAQPLATISQCQTAMRGSGTKTCYIRAGTYSLPSGGMSFGSSDANETWSYYPPDGVNTAVISGSSLAPPTIGLNIGTGATGISFVGLKFTGYSYIVAFSQANSATWNGNLWDGGGTSPWYGLDVYGSNVLIKGNTFQNFAKNNGAGTGIFINSIGFTNSVISSNNFYCLGDFGIQGLDGGVGTVIFYNNTSRNIGEVGGGPAPNCTTNVNNSGTAYEVMGSGPNLWVGNSDTNAQGYSLAAVGTTGSAAMPHFISDNTFHNNSDPSILIDSASGSVVRRNTITSPGSIGMNLGEEHDDCPRSGYSNNLLVTGNDIQATYEAIYVTVSQNSQIFGNTGTIGTITNGKPSSHYAAGVTFPNWAADAGCTVVENSTGNVVGENSFTSSSENAQYGILFETNQTGNTAQYNVLYPYGSPGTAAIQNNSGGSETLTGNQTTSSNAPLSAAPPIANAGPSQVATPGTAVTLSGGSSQLLGSLPVTYSWSQIPITGCPTVTISNTTSATANIVAPTVSQAVICGFSFTASDSNGSTTDNVYVGVAPAF